MIIAPTRCPLCEPSTVHVGWLPATLIVVAVSYQLAWAWLASIPQILGTITVDDTFLYLQFAHETVRSGFPTFDGIHLTNGVQPLWAGILIALAFVCEDKDVLLRVSLTLCALLNAGAGVALIAVAVKLKSRVTVLVVSICWTCYLLGLSPSMLAMENSLHAFIIAAIVLVLADWYVAPDRLTWRRYLLLGFLLALNAGARLDSAVVSIVLGLAVLRQGAVPGTSWYKSVWSVFGPMALTGTVYVLASKAYFGITLPVSGLAKSWYADQFLDGRSSLFSFAYASGAAMKSLLAAPQWLMAEFAPEALQSAVLAVFLALILVPLILRVVAPRLVDRFVSDCPLTGLSKLLVIACAAHLVALSFAILHFSVNPWYHSWLLISWMLWLSWGVQRWHNSPVVARPVLKAAMGALLLFVVVCQGSVVYRQMRGSQVQDLHIARLDLSDWLESRLPPDMLLASWNAGVLAYFTDRPIVNLDGLMNSPEYVRRLTSGDRIKEMVHDMGIDVAIDYNRGDSTIFLPESHDPQKTFRGIWDWGEVTLLHVQPASKGRDLHVVLLRSMP